MTNTEFSSQDAHRPSRPAEDVYQVPEVLHSLLGSEYLAYVLATEPGEQIYTDDRRRVEALELLRSIAESYSADFPLHEKILLLGLQLQQVDDTGKSLSTQLRLANGGSRTEIPAGDAVESALFALALDLFPAELLPRITTDDGLIGISSHGRSIAMSRNPGTVLFARELLNDAELSRLFPSHAGGTEKLRNDANLSYPSNQPFPSNVVSEVIWSTGAGGTLSLRGMTDSLLAYVFALMRIDGNLRAERLPAYVRKAVQLIRNLVAKRRTRLPLVAALSNVHSDGTLRDVIFENGRLVLAEGLGAVFQHIPTDSKAVLLVDTEVQLLDILPPDPLAPQADSDNQRRWSHRAETIEKFSRATAADLLRARLSFTMASETEVIAPGLKAWALPNPLSGGNESWYAAREKHEPYQATVITQDVAASLALWSRHLQSHPDSLLLGSRRLLAATTERLDPLDAFVDAVICWENMLGTAEGEVTFRVCGGLALLLEPEDPAQRVRLFSELKALYSTRSNLIHGAREPEAADAVRNRDRAVQIAIKAMRALHGQADLRDAGSSSERNRRLLLGA